MKPGTIAVLWDRVRTGVIRHGTPLLEYCGVDRDRGITVLDIAMPAMVTSGIYIVLRVVDFFMVSLALPDAALAGLTFGFQYYIIGFTFSLGLSAGTISLVSRHKGAGEQQRADFAVKQSLWFTVLLSTPLIGVAWTAAEPLIDLLTDDPAAIGYGATYLRIVMLATGFRFWSVVCGQGLSGCGDTRTPMRVSFLTVPVNIIANAVLIFGLGPFPALGIAGAAWGTVLASLVSAVVFTAVYLSGRFELRLRLGGKQWDWDVARELVRIGIPVTGMRLVDAVGRFPFLFILGVLGTPIVAAFAIGRRISQFAMIPTWGYSTAASALVGQSLGADDEREATAFGWDSVRITVLTQLAIGLVLVVFAQPLVELFQTETVGQATAFVRIFAVGMVGFGIFQTLQGGLRGAGDTTWPFYGAVTGITTRLAVSALALPATMVFVLFSIDVTPGLGIGVLAIYVAVLLDWYIRAAVNTIRFRSGRWQAVASRAQLSATSTDD